MDRIIQDYYEERFKTFETKGWKDFIEDVENLKDPLLNIKSIKTDKELYFRQGQLDILDFVLSLKSLSEQSYQELVNEDADATI